VCRLAGKELQNLAAVTPWEPKIEYHEIGCPDSRSLQGGLTVSNPFDFMTFEREALLEKHPQGAIVLDYQNPHSLLLSDSRGSADRPGSDALLLRERKLWPIVLFFFAQVSLTCLNSKMRRVAR
jgi:hypothetical protein